jgi:tetratricopeptide (TPR) repeat protein
MLIHWQLPYIALDISSLQILTQTIKRYRGRLPVILYDRAKALKCKVGMAIAFYTMSDLYDRQLRPEEEEKALEESIAMFEDLNDKYLYVLQENAYMSWSTVLMRNNRLDEMAELICKYEKFILPLKAKPYNLFELKIMYHIKTGEYDKAERYCDTLVSIASHPIFNSHVAIHRLKIFAGRGEYDKALEMADKAIELSASVDKHLLTEIRRLKMDILAKTGQTDELLKVALYTIDSNDSLYRKDIAYQIDELRTRFDMDKHVREKEFMRRYISISTVACIMLIIALYIMDTLQPCRQQEKPGIDAEDQRTGYAVCRT